MSNVAIGLFMLLLPAFALIGMIWRDNGFLAAMGWAAGIVIAFVYFLMAHILLGGGAS